VTTLLEVSTVVSVSPDLVGEATVDVVGQITSPVTVIVVAVSTGMVVGPHLWFSQVVMVTVVGYGQ